MKTLVLDVVKSVHAGRAIKVTISGRVGRIRVIGETRQILPFDTIDHSLIRSVLSVYRIFGGSVPFSARQMIEQAILTKVMEFKTSNPDWN